MPYAYNKNRYFESLDIPIELFSVPLREIFDTTQRLFTVYYRIMM